LYVGRNELWRSGGGASATRAMSENGVSSLKTTTAWPSSSSPRRPARPVSWAYSPEVSVARPAPPNLLNRSITTVLAGMLMPSESVSVAKTTPSSPSVKHCSTASFIEGTSPAWWAATPDSSASIHSCQPSASRSSSPRSSVRSSAIARIRRRVPRSRSRIPSRTQ